MCINHTPNLTGGPGQLAIISSSRRDELWILILQGVAADLPGWNPREVVNGHRAKPDTLSHYANFLPIFLLRSLGRELHGRLKVVKQEAPFVLRVEATKPFDYAFLTILQRSWPQAASLSQDRVGMHGSERNLLART